MFYQLIYEALLVVGKRERVQFISVIGRVRCVYEIDECTADREYQ